MELRKVRNEAVLYWLSKEEVIHILKQGKRRKTARSVVSVWLKRWGYL